MYRVLSAFSLVVDEMSRQPRGLATTAAASASAVIRPFRSSGLLRAFFKLDSGTYSTCLHKATAILRRSKSGLASDLDIKIRKVPNLDYVSMLAQPLPRLMIALRQNLPVYNLQSTINILLPTSPTPIEAILLIGPFRGAAYADGANVSS